MGGCLFFVSNAQLVSFVLFGLFCEMGDRWPYICCFIGCCFRQFVQNSTQCSCLNSLLAFSPGFSFKSKWCNCAVVLSRLLLGRISFLFHFRDQISIYSLIRQYQFMSYVCVCWHHFQQMRNFSHTCFNQRSDIFTLNGSSLKLVDKFTHLGSSVSSTETDITTQQAKAWTAIDRLSVIWKSDLTDKMQFFSKQQSYRYCCMDALHGH